ncbi:C2H2-type zinc finger-containing protein [Heterostelium album PN500]|uniref:Ubiquitin thioesterase OTU n=1 Tax=Heterostelium pallidum (strain ATCC 26659 / Pp 5 / PN500) TaxID=670386 RepID=D3BC43_HETP5|nr:C2H2-type zinc finger-containing protein [Heterostelium album PN500]EFA81226.1 C2H2-type zinc finger-containing protein [Heterostelium album PN500]|eukprot:XP_020433344.1 C2H2-type zinc finger-containing protein [Heterostelium album PN500]
MSISIRLRSKSGVENIRSLDPKSSISQFQLLVFEKTNIEPANQKILCGYPPKPLDTSKQDTLIDGIIVNGDTVTVEETTGGGGSSSNTAPTTSSSSSSGVVSSSNNKPREDSGGYIVRRLTENDNSCLFSAVAYVLENKNRAKGSHLRSVIVSAVKSDPLTYNEGYLEKENDDYCIWITNPKHWGGAIELSILSSYYKMEIGAFDIQTKILYRYGEDRNYSQRVFVIYDGIHYDALALCPYENGSENYDKTIFATTDEATLKKAIDFVEKEHKAGKFTNTANFQLICLDCNKILTGEKEATIHAMQTKHISKFLLKVCLYK